MAVEDEQCNCTTNHQGRQYLSFRKNDLADVVVAHAPSQNKKMMGQRIVSIPPSPPGVWLRHPAESPPCHCVRSLSFLVPPAPYSLVIDGKDSSLSVI
jgi:hypothetical protein